MKDENPRLLDDLTPIRRAPFVDALNELEKLMSQSNRVFLLGAGCSKCAGLPITSELTDTVLSGLESTSVARGILTAIKNGYSGAQAVTIEDYMSEIVDLLAIASRREHSGAKLNTIELDGRSYKAVDLQTTLEEIKKHISLSLDTKNLDISVHRQFVKAIHQTLRMGKNANARPVDYMVLNYDTLIEDALALQRIPYTDGFAGGPTGWWESRSYSIPNLGARVLKVHGSIDWCTLDDEDKLPRRVRMGNGAYNLIPREKVLIWPAATKYVEAQRDPFAAIMEIVRHSLRSEIGSQVILTICGYRFSDSHINTELDNALRESEERLTLVVFTSSENLQGQLKTWIEDPSISDQVRIYSKRGFFHGSTSFTADNELPWWRFETLTRLLRGER
jgi:hypothetical protein